MCGCAWVCASVWDEFSEFLLENRVPTSADFNTYPIQIFILFRLNGDDFGSQSKIKCSILANSTV